MIADEDMVITVTNTGYVKRSPLALYRAQNRGGKGRKGMETKDEDFVEHLYVASAHSYILVFTEAGRVRWLKVHEIPEMGPAAKGKAIVNLLQLEKDEKLATTVPVREFSDDLFLIFATEKGTIKKTELSAYGNPRVGGIIGINIDDGDRLLDVRVTDGSKSIMLATAKGYAIRFPEADARPMGRATRGVRGINLRKDDRVVGVATLEESGGEILSIAERGVGKRTLVDQYRLQSRGGKGIINLKVSEKTGRGDWRQAGRGARWRHSHHAGRQDYPDERRRCAGDRSFDPGRQADGSRRRRSPRRRGEARRPGRRRRRRRDGRCGGDRGFDRGRGRWRRSRGWRRDRQLTRGRGTVGPGQLYGAAWVFYLVLGLGGLLWLGWQDGALGAELLVGPSSSLLDLVLDLALGVVCGGLLLGAWELMRRALPGALALEERLREMIGSIRRDEAIGLAIVSGVAEEVFFRGAVQGAWGFIVATALFSILHSGPGREFRLWTLFAAVAGVVLGGLMWWRGGLLAPVVAHVMVNGIQLYRLALDREAEAHRNRSP